MSPTGDLPTMAACNYTNTSYNAAGLLGDAMANILANDTPSSAHLQWENTIAAQQATDAARERRFMTAKVAKSPTTNAAPVTTKEEAAMPNRRIIQVYIADPSDAVPLETSILYTGEQKMTDLTDQELFFEIDIRTILAAHNEKRTKIVDKKVKDRTEYLEPAKVRDLKMVVVTVASF